MATFEGEGKRGLSVGSAVVRVSGEAEPPREGKRFCSPYAGLAHRRPPVSEAAGVRVLIGGVGFLSAPYPTLVSPPLSLLRRLRFRGSRTPAFCASDFGPGGLGEVTSAGPRGVCFSASLR
ncbi:hypothetical protein BRADI_1g35448v3 [Brachypodium distachyon]|uniref:Uncharacterized protein n=1 Tax=Brachypodium distachyon TaxID=15368 RepID=A0A0Q3RY39_BRADI|nr:hypothetical protein BRADI_1g35448v3 [Brachypodium distachyon]